MGAPAGVIASTAADALSHAIECYINTASDPLIDALTISALEARQQESRSPNLDVLILGGRPIREPVAWMGPFVMNTREEVVQAVRDYQAGRLGSVPAIHGAPTSVVESGSQG